MIERVSTNLLYKFGTRSIQQNQNAVYDLSNQISTGRKFNNSFEDPVGIIGATNYLGRIISNDQKIKDRETAISDLSAQEIAISNMIDLTNKVYEIAVAAGNDSLGAAERTAYRNEMRTIGETIVQLVNSKLGDRYLFSGQQTNVQTLRLDEGASFDQAIYKHNQDNGKERYIDGVPSSISLEDTLLGSSDGASLTNRVVNPVTTIASNIDFEVNDGNGNITSFTVNTAVGDNLANIIAAINTEFVNAGGVGTLAHESPNGYLTLDTDLITGSAQNQSARITILPSSNVNLTNEIGVNRQDNFGREDGLLRALTDLENALTANDPVTIRGLIFELQYNLLELNNDRSKVGLLTAQAERLNSASQDLDLKLQSDLSQSQDLDMIDATVRLNNIQLALQTSVQTTANLFNLSLAQFL